MKLITRKTRKAIRKNLKKAINKHGPAIAAGLVGGLASTLATLASNDELVNDGKSRVGKLSDKVQGLMSDGKSRRRSTEKAATARNTRKSFNSALDGDESLAVSTPTRNTRS